MAMACVLNQRIQLRNLWRGLMFLPPWCVPAVVTAYAWRFLFDTTGPINGMIAEFGWRSDYIYFFNDAKIALPALVLVIIWSGTPFWTMNLVAGMQAIPQEMYEAAEIDGAGTFQRFRFITVPSLIPVISVTALLSTIWTSANLTRIPGADRRRAEQRDDDAALAVLLRRHPRPRTRDGLGNLDDDDACV